MVTPPDILGSMITPAVLISAGGTLIISTSNRLARSVERVRELSTEAMSLRLSAPTEFTSQRAQFIVEQLGHLSARVLLLRNAMMALYTAIGILVLTSIAVGISALFDWRFGWVPVSTGLIGSKLLLVGSLLLVREARLAVHSTLNEMRELEHQVSSQT